MVYFVPGISLLCQREKELSAVRIGASSYIFKKRLGLWWAERFGQVKLHTVDGIYR